MSICRLSATMVSGVLSATLGGGRLVDVGALHIGTIADAEQVMLAAVEALLRLQGDRPAVITEAVLVYAAQTFDDDGDTATMIAHAYPAGPQPYHRTLGLLDYMQTRLRAQIGYVEGDDD